jgi:hypothetical protein
VVWLSAFVRVRGVQETMETDTMIGGVEEFRVSMKMDRVTYPEVA